MDKKELRKELELALVNAMESILSKKNAEATKKMRKITHEAGKSLSKKFYKSIKEKTKTKMKAKPKAKSIVKTKTKAVASKAVKKTKSKK